MCVYENRCVLFTDQGYFRGGGPSSRPRCIGPFIAPSSIFIAAPLSSPISDQLAVTDVSLRQSHPSLCGNIPTSRRLHPTLYNGFFFFILTQWLKKKGRGEGGGGERELQLLLAESRRRRLRIDRQPRKWLPSERRQWQPATDEGGGWRMK